MTRRKCKPPPGNLSREEQVALVRESVQAWNAWRKANYGTTPDLKGCDLSSINLQWAKLQKADLRGANLRNAHLQEAKLQEAQFRNADLSGANLLGVRAHNADFEEASLHQARLERAVFQGANLKWARLLSANLYAANFQEADLPGAHLEGADLQQTDFQKANLAGAGFLSANLDKADLRGADLRTADLRKACLSGANLQNAQLQGSNMSEGDLCWADLSGAALQGADLQLSLLIHARFSNADLTGVRLYGTARDDWDIGGVKCDYVFWDAEGEQRSPADRDLRPGEFEELYASLPKIEYVFEEGMAPVDPLIMDRIAQAIRDRTPEYDLQIDSILAEGGAPRIVFTVRQAEHRESALADVRRAYEDTVNELRDSRTREALMKDLLSSALQAPRFNVEGDANLLVDNSVTAGANATNIVTGDDSSASAGDIDIDSAPQPPEQESSDATE